MKYNSNVPEILYWIDKSKVNSEVYVNSRKFSEKYNTDSRLSKSEKENLIYKEHIYIEKYELSEILDVVLKEFNFEPFGMGLELGAGCAAISVSLAKKFPHIKKIYAVEIVPDIVEFAQVELIRLNSVDQVVVPVVGSFDSMQLKGESIDWIIEFDSLHHSFNLEVTANEAFRVLKPNGKLIVIDRAHWNTRQKRLENLESIAYSEEWLEQRGLDKKMRITRSQNGEHEHLLSTYIEIFQKVGFRKTTWRQLISTDLNGLKISLINLVPWKLRAKTKYHYIQTWPIWLILVPVLYMKIFNKSKLGNFVRLDRKFGSKRFHSKTIIQFTK